MTIDAEHSITRQTIAESSKWVFTGTVLSKPVQLGMNVLLARVLGPASFGVLGLATSMAVTLSLISALGLGDASYKYVAEYYAADRGRARRMSSVIFWSTSVFSATLFVLAWLLRSFWVDRLFPPTVPTAIVALCLVLAWMNVVSAVVVGIFSGLQHFRDFTITNLLQVFFIAALALPLAFRGTRGALFAYVIGSGLSIAWGISRLLTNDRALLSWPGLASFRELRSMLHFSTPIWLGSFALTPVVTLTFIFLARQPGGDSQLGFFNTANGLRMLVAILPGIIGTVITPALIREGGVDGDDSAYRALLVKGFSAICLATIPLLIVCLFLGDILLSIYGKAYSGSFRLFLPLVSAAGVAAVGTPLVTVMMAKNKTWWSLAFGVLKAVLLILLSVWLVPTYLASGLTWAFVISEISFYFIAFEFCIRVRAISSDLRATFYSSTLTIGMLLLLAFWLPATVRWVTAVPLTVLSAIYILRSHDDLAKWLPNIVPRVLQPPAQKLLGLIAS